MGQTVPVGAGFGMPIKPPKNEQKAKGGLATKGRRMMHSEKMMAQYAARRIVKQVLVTGVKMADEVTIIQPKDFGKLNVDESYQRVRVGDEVNGIIHAIRDGGLVPDPIDVAERPDKSWWIVDGQQRFWAHDETKTPLRAMIHRVESKEAEANLFFALNSRRRLTPRVLIKGWPGPIGDFVRRVNEDPKSPLRGRIDMTNQSKLPVDAVTLVKGVLAVTTGINVHSGDMATRILPRADAAVRETGAVAWAEQFVNLLAGVFCERSTGRVRVLPVIALGLVAHRKYKAAGRPIFPSSLGRLRQVNWDTIVPSHAKQYLPILEAEIEKRWK